MLTVQETCPSGDLSLTLHENYLYPPPDFARKHVPVEIKYNAIICGHTEIPSTLRSCQPLLRISILSGKIRGGRGGGKAPRPMTATNNRNN